MSNNAERQAERKLACIVQAMRHLYSTDSDDALHDIWNMPLSIEVRGDWCPVGFTPEVTEYRILLCTGGPACQIRGRLDGDGVPYAAELQYQDWFEPWKTFFEMSDDEAAMLLEFARQFTFTSGGCCV